MASFHFPVVAGSPRLDQLVGDAELLAESIEGMDHVGVAGMGELKTVIRLNSLRDISQESDGAPDEVDSGVRGLFPIGEDEAFPGSLVDEGVLVIAGLGIVPGEAGPGDAFHVQLGLLAEQLRGIVRLGDILLVCLPWDVVETQTAEDPVEGSVVAGVADLDAELRVELVEACVRVSPDEAADFVDFLVGMGLGMRGKRPVRFGGEGTFRTVKHSHPSHQTGFRDMVFADDEPNGGEAG